MIQCMIHNSTVYGAVSYDTVRTNTYEDIHVQNVVVCMEHAWKRVYLFLCVKVSSAAVQHKHKNIIK